MRPTRRGALAALTALALAATAACGDDDGGGGAGGSGPLGSLADAIQTIPLEELDEGAMISWADVDAATEAAGLERPTADDLDALGDWANGLTVTRDAPLMIPFAETLQLTTLMQAEEFDEELGWSIADVGAFIELHLPPGRFFVGSGDLGLDGDGLTELGDGLHTAGSGDDLATDLEGVTAARPLGRPLRLAEVDGLLAASLRTGPLERWVEGEGDRLDDHDGIARVAAAIDDADAVSAVLYVRSVDLPWAHDVVGIGWSVVDGDPVMTIAFHLTGNDHEAAASALEEALSDGRTLRGQPVSDLIELEEITVDDGVLVATVSPGPEYGVQVPLQMLQTQDVPFQAPVGP